MRLGDGKLVGRGGDGDDAPAHELGDLDGRKASTAGGAEHRDGLAGLQPPAILEPEERRAVGDRNAGSGLVADPIGDRNGVACLDRHLLAAAIAADRGHAPFAPARSRETPGPKASMVPATSPPGEWGSVGVT